MAPGPLPVPKTLNLETQTLNLEFGFLNLEFGEFLKVSVFGVLFASRVFGHEQLAHPFVEYSAVRF